MNPNEFMYQTRDHPYQHSKYFDLVDGHGRPSDTIQTACLMHELMQIQSVSESTSKMVNL